jgi:uncharacterized protein
VIELEETSDGIILPVQAQPKAQKNGIVGEHAGRLKVAVTEPPDKGKANDALVRVLASALALKRAEIELVSGQTSATKRFRVAGVGREELAARIAACLEET